MSTPASVRTRVPARAGRAVPAPASPPTRPRSPFSSALHLCLRIGDYVGARQDAFVRHEINKRHDTLAHYREVGANYSDLP